MLRHLQGADRDTVLSMFEALLLDGISTDRYSVSVIRNCEVKDTCKQ